MSKKAIYEQIEELLRGDNSSCQLLGFRLRRRKTGPDGGTARLYIDERFEKTLDYKRSVHNPHDILFSKSGCVNGEHAVRIEVIDGRVSLGPFDQWESYK